MTEPMTSHQIRAEHESPALQALHEKLADALIPGYLAEFDPDEAERAGAFAEDALSEVDARESAMDLMDATPSAVQD
ncbi:MAG: conjugal transfer protein TraD [Burkholderiaceae bacterium]|jgi:hypothetical protein|nr:conjugal transfer protein TraD [Burkholderiaceae bacterium]